MFNDCDAEKIFISNRQIDMGHFYYMGHDKYSYGYFTMEGIYHYGIVHFRGEIITKVSDLSVRYRSK